jgi:uncharacterized protein
MKHSKSSTICSHGIYSLAVLIFLALSSIFLQCNKQENIPSLDTTKKNNSPKIPFVKQGEVSFEDKEKKLVKGIDVEIADTDDKRHTGLMFRESMEDNQGMLFIFPREEPQGFYMRNTIIPLDIIFINSKGLIVKIYKNTTPFSEEDLPSIKPILYVVEVNGGFSDKYKIKEGDMIEWRRF